MQFSAMQFSDMQFSDMQFSKITLHRAWQTISRRVVLGFVVLGLTAAGAACSDGEDPNVDGIERGIVIVESDDENDDGSEDETAAADDGADDQDEVFAALEGTTINPLDLEPGDCFNEYRYRDRANVLQQITTTVDCDRPHDKEMYHVAVHPAAEDAPYRGKDELDRFARDECLDMFEEFVGEEYVLSQLEIGIFQPSYETWISEERDRDIGCYIYPYAADRRLQGSMASIGL